MFLISSYSDVSALNMQILRRIGATNVEEENVPRNPLNGHDKIRVNAFALHTAVCEALQPRHKLAVPFEFCENLNGIVVVVHKGRVALQIISLEESVSMIAMHLSRMPYH